MKPDLRKVVRTTALILTACAALPMMISAALFSACVTVTDGNGKPVVLLTQDITPEDILRKAGLTLEPFDEYLFTEVSDRTYSFQINRAFNVSVLCDGEERKVPILHGTVADVLENGGITLGEFDSVTPALTSEVTEDTRITVSRAFYVPLTCDGEESLLPTQGGTVADLIRQAGITLGEDDVVSPALDEEITADTEIRVSRVIYKTITEEEVIPYEINYKYTPLLRNGVTRTLIAGSDGALTRTTVEKYVDGVFTETVSEEETIVKYPSSATVLAGSPSAVVSNYGTGGVALDANGVPLSYSYKVTGKGTAYSAYPGAGTASGRPALPGHVAVNPNVIPYGSRLYIRSTDGSFVYGYAVAADTGTGLMAGIITVDLYFDTYLESCLFGAKTMEIYVLN